MLEIHISEFLNKLLYQLYLTFLYKLSQINLNDFIVQMMNLNSNVDVAFMMDATGSMGKHITAVKDGINSIVSRIHDKFKKAKIRVAFVAYRDYGDGAKHFEILDFTENIEIFTNFVGGISATGGDDSPEDVLGAIDKTIKLSWKAANKIFYHAGKSFNRHQSYLGY